MKDPIQPNRCATQLNALAAPERLRIIRFLRDGPRNVTEIATMLHTKPVNVSHHLAVLRHAKIVKGSKRGRFVYYALVPGILVPSEEQPAMELLNLGCCQLQMPCACPADSQS
ncbi:MAG TPA: metalloregulator ArsR/SmtB family transcription factor [Gemmataceae bacterium]|jgi:DNA-binding transcriptional ArsR family regulator|nr:metalloregulator ArsR/SmtB family transcription factor [Gemmataceae bacterium]